MSRFLWQWLNAPHGLTVRPRAKVQRSATSSSSERRRREAVNQLKQVRETARIPLDDLGMRPSRYRQLVEPADLSRAENEWSRAEVWRSARRCLAIVMREPTEACKRHADAGPQLVRLILRKP
jgi:hypothetical protein